MLTGSFSEAVGGGLWNLAWIGRYAMALRCDGIGLANCAGGLLVVLTKERHADGMRALTSENFISY